MRIILCHMIFLFFACAPPTPRVVLSAPSPGAPFEERLEAYMTLRVGDTVSLGAEGQTSSLKSVEFLILADGTILDNPEDLLPVVDEDTATARETAKYIQSKERRRAARIVAAVLVVGSLVTLGAAEERGSEPLLILAGAEAGVAVGALLTGFISVFIGETHRWKALGAYPASLRSSLGICVEKETKQIYDCFEGPPGGRSNGITRNDIPTEAP
jgi:hypothetical protein